MRKKANGGVVTKFVPETPIATERDDDIKAKIHDYALFFDKLVELIPAQFYLPVDDDKPWFQGLSKIAKASAKAETRRKIKLARQQRLDPENANVSTVDILKQSIIAKKEEEEKEDDSNDDEEEEEEIDIKPIKDLDDDVEIADQNENQNQNKNQIIRSATYEELQQRLHSKLEQLRNNRGQGKRSNFNRERPFKRKREFDDAQGEDLGKSQKSELDVEEAAQGIEFGKVKIEDGDKKKKMKGSKASELEKAMKLAESKKDPEVSKKHSWQSAASRAAGMKVHDDPKILKNSIKKDQKRREKNADKWKERMETVEKIKGDKQKKRAGNIADRVNDKKARKIAKREKKLMRPGFEGRKQGYIS